MLIRGWLLLNSRRCLTRDQTPPLSLAGCCSRSVLRTLRDQLLRKVMKDGRWTSLFPLNRSHLVRWRKVIRNKKLLQEPLLESSSCMNRRGCADLMIFDHQISDCFLWKPLHVSLRRMEGGCACTLRPGMPVPRQARWHEAACLRGEA